MSEYSPKFNSRSYFGTIAVEEFNDIRVVGRILVKGSDNWHTSNFNELF